MLDSAIQCSQCRTHLSARGWSGGRGGALAPRAVRCRVCGRSSRTTFGFRRSWLARQLMRLLAMPTTLLSYLTLWVTSINEGDDVAVAAFIALPAAAVGLAASYGACQLLSVPAQAACDAGHAAMRLVWRDGRGRVDARGASAGGGRPLAMDGVTGGGEAPLDNAASATARATGSCDSELRSAA